MNATAQKLHMKTTKYSNPHGLADRSNHSTASELAFLSSFAMKNSDFRKIVNLKQYNCTNTYLPLKKLVKKYP